MQYDARDPPSYRHNNLKVHNPFFVLRFQDFIRYMHNLLRAHQTSHLECSSLVPRPLFAHTGK